MSKNIYFFGDSFSNFIPTDTEYLKTLPTKFLHWTNQISTHLNIDTNDIIDLSRSGMSPQEIFDKCLSTSSKMKKGDWVIISDSPTIRQIGYDKRYKEIRTYNNETLFWRWETDGIQLRKQMNNYDNYITTYID